MEQLPKRPTTSQQVIECLSWKGWDARIAFYEGSRICRRLDAKLIRETVAELRKRRSLSRDVSALVEAVDPRLPDHDLKNDWQNAIDALRTLFRASPKGTSRERNLLLDVARNGKVVSGMQAAAKSAKDIDPTWMAVFTAEGSPTSRSIADRFRKDYAKRHPGLLRALDAFTGALEVSPGGAPGAPSSRAPGSTRAGPKVGRAMDVDRVWEIVDRASASGDPAESLRELLEGLSAREVAAFHRHFFAMLRKAYRYDLWGAAYVLLGGCSDDAFRDFRAALIGKGRVVFESVLRDPDSLADHTDVEGDETLPSVSNHVYVEKAGKDLPSAPGERGQPIGKRWDFDDDQQMRRRYPRLFRRSAKTG
jgi:hypothetical protein